MKTPYRVVIDPDGPPREGPPDEAAPAGPPATIPIQPQPIRFITSQMPVPGGTVTAIARVWAPGDTRRCLLCPQCRADHASGVCLVQANFFVAPDEAALFSIHGLNLIRSTGGETPGEWFNRRDTDPGGPGR